LQWLYYANQLTEDGCVSCQKNAFVESKKQRLTVCCHRMLLFIVLLLQVLVVHHMGTTEFLST